LEGSEYTLVAELEMHPRRRGCMESPVAKLLRFLRELREGEGIKVLTDSRFPYRAVEALVRKMGLGFEHLGKEGGYDACVVYKPRERGTNNNR